FWILATELKSKNKNYTLTGLAHFRKFPTFEIALNIEWRYPTLKKTELNERKSFGEIFQKSN
ncbi:MAG: hypothetical protein ACJASR_002429, partial [Psychroserpens sp.]